MGKGMVILCVLIFLFIPLILSIQFIFLSPTLSDDFWSASSNVFVNASLDTENLSTLIFSWNNGTEINYSVYDDFLIAGFNFNNNSNIGENSLNFKDISKYSKNVTFKEKWVAGQVGNGLEFDGVSNYVDCGSDSSLTFGNNSFSVFTWVKFDSEKTNQYFLNGKLTDNSRWHMYISSGNSFNFYIVDNDSNSHSKIFTSDGSYSTDTWYHVGFVRDKSIGNITIYLNGSQVTSFTDNTVYMNSQGILLGAYSASLHFFNGTLDEVMVWNRSLNSTEVDWIYQRGLQELASNVSTSGLVAYWNLDEETGTTANDNSENSNSGTLNSYSYCDIVDGKFDSGISFGGISDYFFVNDSYDSEEYSFVGWIKPLFGSESYIFDLGSSMNLYFNSSNHINANALSAGGEDSLSLSLADTSAINNTWIHVGLVYDKESSKLSYYENGELKKNETAHGYYFNNVYNTSYNNTVYDGHIQGLDTDKSERIFLSFTKEVKAFYVNGTEICNTGEVTLHHGDCAYNDDKIYIAHSTDSVWVYNSTNCTFIESFALSEFPGGIFPGGMAYYNGHFFVAEGISYGDLYSNVHEYDGNFNYLSSHLINYSLTQGIQDIGRFNGSWWIGAYDTGTPLIRLNDSFEVEDIYEFSAQLGFEGWNETFVLEGHVETNVSIYWKEILRNQGNLKNFSGIYLGSEDDVSSFFNGVLDEIRIYNRSLSSDEIKIQYNLEFQKYNSSRWMFYENMSGLSNGNYRYYLFANNTIGNIGRTLIRRINLGVQPVPETSLIQRTFSGIYSPSAKDLEQGYSKTFRENYEVKFEFNNEDKKIIVQSISEDEVRISVNDKGYSVSVNSSKKIDIDNDGYYDLEISVNSISSDSTSADLEFKSIHEEIPASEQESQEEFVKDEKKSKWYLWIGGIIVIGILYFIFRRKFI